MKRLDLALLSVVAVVCASSAQAQDKYPVQADQGRWCRSAPAARPTSPSASSASSCGSETGHGFVIENKPGAFGILAIEEMVKAPPDGYTLQVGNPGTNVLTPIIYKDKFKIDYEKEVTMVTRLGEVPLILAATTKDFEPKTYAEFIAYAKANPGKVRYASVGVGSNNHYDTEAFAQWAGIKLMHIPNKGGGGAITNDVVARRRSCRPGQRRELGGLAQGGQAPGSGGDGGRAAAGISGCADAQGTGLRERQGPVVGALCADEDAADVLETLHGDGGRRSAPRRCRRRSRSR